MNSVNIIGRLVQSPPEKLRYSSGGAAFMPFTLAVGRVTGAEGNKATDWIDCIAFQKTALNMAAHLEKGSLIAVEGRIQTRNYENQEGQKRKQTEVVVQRVQFLGRKGSVQNPELGRESSEDMWVDVSADSIEEGVF